MNEVAFPRLGDDAEKFSWKKRIGAKLAIAALIAGVVAWDVLSPKGSTISEEIYRMRRTKIGKYVVPWAVTTVAHHLLEQTPLEQDWIYQVSHLGSKD